jgi:unsaturated chondroitin disaccharide hydrolase
MKSIDFQDCEENGREGAMLQQAIEDAIEKVRRNIDIFGDSFPHVSEKGKYLLNENDEWTSGFWPGLVWLCFEYSRDETFRKKARKVTESFERRLEENRSLEHHDIGFLYSLSAKAQWIVEHDETAKSVALQAAGLLTERWRPQAGIIQAWGPENDPKNGGRIIIDCLMNLPLLYWAHAVTGDNRYSDIAVRQADISRRYLVRGDDSTYHTFYFDPATGIPIGGGTHQGYHDGSTWTRGQAWGIYGFALSYRYTRNPVDFETALRLARYFLARVLRDGGVYWDFEAPVAKGTARDSSASAIAACGMLELLELLPSGHSDTDNLRQGADRIVRGLTENYSTIDDPEAEGLLRHGSYSVRAGQAIDDYMIWGDYFYLEALLRMDKNLNGYWYE